MANGWSWQNEFFKGVSKKAYGNTYDEKLKNTENALGRTDGQTRMFQDYMNSLAPARPKKIRQSDYKDINTLSKWDQEIAAADKKRKEKEQAAKKKKEQQKKQQQELEYNCSQHNKRTFSLNRRNSLKAYGKIKKYRSISQGNNQSF
jgi:hypothetical protein